MPNLTTNFSLNKPLVNDPVDEDLWGAQLNTNADTIDDRLTPTGVIMSYAGTTAPNADWLLCDGSAVSRTTYSVLFALVSTSFGTGDGSTTFNVPDLRGRVAIGLDNLGGSSADRITDANADDLNNTGGGSESTTSTGSVGTSGGTAITTAQMPAHTHTMGPFSLSVISNSSTAEVWMGSSGGTVTSSSTGSNSPHTHSGGTFSGDAVTSTQPWLALGAIIKT